MNPGHRAADGQFESFERPESAPVSCHSRRAVFNRNAGSKLVRNILILTHHWEITPSARSKRLFVVFCLIGLIASYAGELYQSRACSTLSKAITTM